MRYQKLKFAKDRRKKKSRIKAAIFFVALLSICTGVVLLLKDTAEKQPAEIAAQEPDYETIQVQVIPLTEDEKNSSILSATKIEKEDTDAKDESEEVARTSDEQKETPAPMEIDIPVKEDENATSYNDELEAKDDEVDEIKIDDDEAEQAQTQQPQLPPEEELPEEAKNALNDLLDAADTAIKISDQFSHTVVKGDSLRDILELSGLDDDTSRDLIASYPELKRLKPGQQFYWILDDHGDLDYMNWLVSEKEERIYELTPEGNYKRQILEKTSIWKKEILKGAVGKSLTASLTSQGISSRQINQLTTALQWQVNMKKLNPKDKFALLVSREYLGDKLTGQGNVEAIHIMTEGKSYYAIQASNGRYYNRQGETLGKGFARYPLQFQARISSPFNPKRLHPITRRVAPHRGVDFALPTGTPVIAPADGIIEKVAYQARGAGRYVVIRHAKEYQTVYMHLSKPLVKAGQSIKRGERIALSGNTGGSTGPHLHYEFHINGRPVNPITVKLPGSSSGMETKERKEFLTIAKSAEARLKL